MTRLLQALSVVSALSVTTAAFADEAKCSCDKTTEQCQQAGCTCGSGACPMHGRAPGMGHGQHSGKGGMMGHAMPTFDPKTVTSLSGTLLGIDRVEHGNGFVGVHLRVKTSAEIVVVHAGPAFFIDPKMTFEIGKAIDATGSKIDFQNEPTLLATLISQAGKSVEIRKADGTPLFRGPGMMKAAGLATPDPKK